MTQFGSIIALLLLQCVLQRAGAQQDLARPVAQHPSGNRPPPPDDPAETDVAKRRTFIHELNHQRINLGFQYPELLKDARDAISQQDKATLIRLAGDLLSEGLRAPGLEDVQWLGNWGTYANPDAPQGVERRLKLIVAEWSGGEVTVQVWQSVDSPHRLTIRVRMPRRADLQFHPRPTDLDFGPEYRMWQFVAQGGLRRVLQDIFRFPPDSQVEVRSKGQLDSIAGVSVFTGRLVVSDPTATSGERTNPDDPAWAWRKPDDVFITDSDPQYICVSFDLSEQTGADPARP